MVLDLLRHGLPVCTAMTSPCGLVVVPINVYNVLTCHGIGELNDG